MTTRETTALEPGVVDHKIYVRGLGMRAETFGAGWHALIFGRQKLNLHEAAGAPILPRATSPAPGSADSLSC